MPACRDLCLCGGGDLDQSVHTHTWSQLAANEVPDKHAVAATLHSPTLHPDTEAEDTEPPPLVSNEDFLFLKNKTNRMWTQDGRPFHD